MCLGARCARSQMLIYKLPNHLLVLMPFPPHSRLRGPLSSYQVPSNPVKTPPFYLVGRSLDENWGDGRWEWSTWHHCSHAGASFRPSSLNCGSRGFDPYGTAQLSVGVIKHYQHFSEQPRAKNKLEMKHVMKWRGFCSTQYPCCWWAFLPCSFSWLGTHSVHTLRCSYCDSMQSCLEFISWDLRLLCAMNYGLFIIDTKLSGNNGLITGNKGF